MHWTNRNEWLLRAVAVGDFAVVPRSGPGAHADGVQRLVFDIRVPFTDGAEKRWVQHAISFIV